MAAVGDQQLSVEMVDDNMDVSSDYGHTAPTDEIDIDIDLPTAHGDEDQMLEDAQSDLDVEERDDLMVDGDQETFPMNDVDEHQDLEVEDVHIEDVNESEILEPEVAETEDHTFLDGGNDEDHLELNGESEIGWEESNTFQVTEVDEGIEEVTSTNAAFEVSSASAQPAVEDPLPAEHIDNEVAIENGEAVEPHDIAKDAIPPAQTQEVAAKGVEVKNLDLSDASKETEQPQAVLGGQNTEKLIDVIVLYRDVEYALIASSEDDNPDHFFFNDDLPTKQPLSSFLGGLREVLRDDVPQDDEICITIEDLGIDISESSAARLDATFASIIELRTSLLHIDGVDAPGPMYVLLGTKPDCMKRIAFLKDGLAKGQGLSQLGLWLDGGANPDDTEDESGLLNYTEDDDKETGSQVDGYENKEALRPEGEVVKADEENQQADASPAESLGANDHESADKQQKAQLKEDTKDTPFPAVDQANASGHDSKENQHDEQDRETERVDDADDGADDIIDYSDEEGDEEVQDFSPEALTSESKPDGDDEASQAADIEGATNYLHVTAESDEVLHRGEENNQNSAEDVNGEHASYGDAVDAQNVVPGAPEDRSIKNAEDTTDEPIAAADGAQLESGQQTEDELNEIDFGEEEPPAAAAVNPLDTTQTQENLDDNDEIGYEDVVLDGESNESEPTLVGDDNALQAAKEDGEDEIDYDEDDQTEAVNNSSSEEVSGKRAYAEVEDQTDLPKQDSKRVRS